MLTARTNSQSLIISYLTLRKAVGVLGISLPIVLLLSTLSDSISLPRTVSHFYYTPMQDTFVGIMCAIGLFMFSYNGYNSQERLFGLVACVCAVGLALVPTAQTCTAELSESFAAQLITGCEDCLDGNFLDCLHKAFALLFFLILACFSIFSFVKTEAGTTPTPQKIRRNRIYRIAGYTMLGSLVLIVAIPAFQLYLPGAFQSALNDLMASQPIFWLESIMITAFGVSWLVKGEAIMKDKGLPTTRTSA